MSSKLQSKSTKTDTSSVSKVSDLLKDLPTAEQLKNEVAASPAAAQRKQEYEERQAQRKKEYEERQARREVEQDRKRELRDSYSQRLATLTQTKVNEATEQGYGWVVIEEAYLPTKTHDPVTDDDVYDHTAAETHWAGMDEEGHPLPAEEGGVPKVLLLQGPRVKGPDGQFECDSTKLPDGLSSVDILRKSLESRKYKVDVSYRGKTKKVVVTVIWDHVEWKARELRAWEHRAQRRQDYQKDNELSSRQMSVSEFRAMKGLAPLPVAAPQQQQRRERKPRS